LKVNVNVKDLVKDLDGLKKNLQNKILRKATTKAARIFAAEEKKLVPVDTGTLKRNIITKVKTSKKSGVFGLAGAKSVTVDFDGQIKNPAKYSHLVEKGTVHSRPQPFIEPAAKNKEGEALQIFANEIKKLKP